jgi:putative ABC transport system permease protein
MRWISDLRYRLKATFSPHRMEKEMDEEMEFHLEMEIKKLIRQGMDPVQARQEALRNFGEPMRQREKARDSWGIRWIQDFKSDSRLTVRTFKKSPVLTLVAIITLALGIGGTTSIFSVVNGVLLKPLPYPEADRLVRLTHTMPGIDTESTPLGPALFRTYRDHSRSLESIGIWQIVSGTVTGLAEPERVIAIRVSEDLLPLLGVHPILGRSFTPEDTGPSSTSPVILSNGYWRSRFGSDPDVLNRTLTLQGMDRPIIGVMPPGLRIQDQTADIYQPIRLDLQNSQGVGNWSFGSIARLMPGMTVAQTTLELTDLTPLACELYPGIPLEELERRRFGTVATPLKAAIVGQAQTTLWVVFGTVGLILLMACTNVANLFLVKAEGRTRDVALRTALGASKGRLIRQSITESVLIGLVGAGMGLALAHQGIRLLVRLAPPMLPRLQNITLDPLTLAFTLGVTLSVSLFFGILPSLRREGDSLSEPLKEGAKSAGGSRGRTRTRNAFAVLQIALALVLLAGSGLMARTFLALGNVPPGYQRPEEVLTFRISIPTSEAPSAEDLTLGHQAILQRISEIPGVTSVSAAASVAMESWQSWEDAFLEDFPIAEGDPNPLRRLNWLSPGHFGTLENPLVAGRDFEWADIQQRTHVAIVSQAFVREYWPTPQDALGKRFRMADYEPWQEIIGVAGDVRSRGVREDPPAILYFPFVMEGLWGRDPFIQRSLRYAVRTSRPSPTAILPEIRQAVGAVNPSLPLSGIRTLEDIFSASIARTTFTLVMLGLAALVAVVLGMVGVYGIISYLVSQRTQEMGVRMAMGATRAQVTTMVLRQGGWLAGVGILFGLGAAMALTRLMGSLLFGVNPVDPLTFGLVSASLMGVVLLASYLPARRAAGVDPTEALRGD